ncbi:hypothetical protein B0T21DRAFT_57883 [Apiosordaria backusii]|uniref:Uncharacterized protein n=1 Tax=Apiosordaria backusii TaxID=314023 RepID=A0AA40AN22_9PEZI|nr:hypothetical protein B0T21DRAFT_57883 [Apiosordaria backusii]
MATAVCLLLPTVYQQGPAVLVARSDRRTPLWMEDLRALSKSHGHDNFDKSVRFGRHWPAQNGRAGPGPVGPVMRSTHGDKPLNRNRLTIGIFINWRMKELQNRTEWGMTTNLAVLWWTGGGALRTVEMPFMQNETNI